MNKELKLECWNYHSNEDVENEIQVCQNENHVQQVAFSTYHHAITQICFNCKKIRTSLDTKEFAKCKNADGRKDDE